QTWFLANDPVYIMLTEKLVLSSNCCAFAFNIVGDREEVNKWRPEYEDREEDL
ncbi:unnamed protein product, partial [Brassica oleracea]